jgi:hypothetical protein
MFVLVCWLRRGSPGLPWVWDVPSPALSECFQRPTMQRPSSQDEREGSLFGVGHGWFCLFPNLQTCWSFLKAAGSSFGAALPTP